MNPYKTLKTISYSLLSAALLLATACSEDALIEFPDEESNGDITYTICGDSSAYPEDTELSSTNFVGHYVKTRELVCGVTGCNEAPFVSVQYAGITPSFELMSDGSIINPDGPFTEYESWMYIAAESSDVPNRFELVDSETPGDTFQVIVLSAGPCRIRVENAQGWIEYSRLEEA